VIDLNSTSQFADRVNFLIDEAMKKRKEESRNYLGASVVGHDCERHVQFHLLAARGEVSRPTPEPRILRIFDRGNVYEDKCRALLSQAGFVFEPGKLTWPDMVEEQAGFEEFDGRFKGHIDGQINRGPDTTMVYPLLWEHKCLGNKGFTKLEKDKLKEYSNTYFGQCQIYMHYMKLGNCLFSATNADTMEIYHELIPYDEDYANGLLGRVAHVLMVTDAGEMVPRCTQDRNLFTCKWCDFAGECWR
jgi:hypothetical protein